VAPLNLILPDAPSPGHAPVPSPPGPKMQCLQLKIPFAITPNGPPLCWRFRQPQCAQDPTTLTQNPNESVEIAPTKMDQPQRNPAQWSPHDVDCSTVAPAGLCSTLILILSQLEHPFQTHLALFLTTTNNNIFQCSCPTQWPTAFLVSCPIPSFNWLPNHGNNPQTLPMPRTFSIACAVASLAKLGTSSGTPKPRCRSFFCSPTDAVWSKLEQETLRLWLKCLHAGTTVE